MDEEIVIDRGNTSVMKLDADEQAVMDEIGISAGIGPKDVRGLSLSTGLGLVTLVSSDQAIFGGVRVRVGARQGDPR